MLLFWWLLGLARAAAPVCPDGAVPIPQPESAPQKVFCRGPTGAFLAFEALQSLSLDGSDVVTSAVVRRVAGVGKGWLPLATDGEELLVVAQNALVGLPLHGTGPGWRVELVGTPVEDIAVDGAEVAVLADGGWLVVVDRVARQVTWLRTGRPVTRLAGIRDGLAVIQEPVGRLVGVDLDDGAVRWKSPTYYSPVQPLVVGGIGVVTRGRDLVGLDLQTGLPAWSLGLDAKVVATASSFDGRGVVALDAAGRLAYASVSTGEPLWQASPPGLDRQRVRGAEVRVDQDGIFVIGRSAIWRMGLDGTAMGRRRVPDERVTGVDVFGRWACAVSQEEALVCVDRSGRPVFEVPVGRGTIPPLVLDPWIHVLAGRDLLTVDGETAQAKSWAGSEEAQVRATGDRVAVLLDAKQEAFGLTGVPAEVNTVEVLGAEDGEGCQKVTTLIDLGGAVGEAQVPGRPVAIPSLAWSWGVETIAWSFAEGWVAALQESGVDASYVVTWAPRIVAARAFEAEPETEAWLAAVLACQAGGGSFEGEIVLNDGWVGRRWDGVIRLEPFPHRLDGEEGCLVEIAVGGEPAGVWGVPGLPAWMDLHMAVTGATPEGGSPDPLPVLPGDASIEVETLLPGGVDRVERGFEPPATLALIDGEIPLLVLASEEGGHLEIPIPDLVPVVPDPEDETGLFTGEGHTWLQSWELRLPEPDVDATLVPLVEARVCPGEVE